MAFTQMDYIQAKAQHLLKYKCFPVEMSIALLVFVYAAGISAVLVMGRVNQL